jgi:hypothetical protein
MLTLMIGRAKGLELMNNLFEDIWFKNVLELENYGFLKLNFFNKNSCLCDKGHECII